MEHLGGANSTIDLNRRKKQTAKQWKLEVGQKKRRVPVSVFEENIAPQPKDTLTRMLPLSCRSQQEVTGKQPPDSSLW